MDNIKNFLESEKIPYNKLDLYKVAFTHSSYSNESKENENSYERLEFLGDSILGKIVSEHLYKEFPEYDEGEMTLVKHRLVNKDFLGDLGKELKFEKIILLGVGEKNNELAFSIYGDLFESLIAAIYLDIGYDEAKKFVDKHITSKSKSISSENAKDPKTTLQELLQGESRGSITYNTSPNSIKGSPNKFISQVMFEGEILGKGEGPSKKDAQKEAAKAAIERMVR